MSLTLGYGLRVTLFFDDQGSTGWSETHYDTVRTTLQGAIQAALNLLVVPRINLLAAGPWLKYIRASKDGVFRDAQVAFLPAPPVNRLTNIFINNQDWAQTSAAVDWTTALLRGVGGDFYRRQVYISGVPYIDPTDIGAPQQDPTLVGAAGVYADALTKNGYGFPVWARDPGVVAPVPIVSIAPGIAPAGYLFTTALGHGLPMTFDPVKTTYRAFLHGLRFLPTPGTQRRPVPSPNGGYPYTYVSPTQFNLPTWVFPGPNLVNQYSYIGSSGTIQAQQRAVTTYQVTGGVLLERFTHRKRGRPFDQQRGRSRNRAIFAQA